MVYTNALGGTGEITFNPPVTVKAGETLRVKYSRRCKPINNESAFTHLYIYSNDTALLSLTEKPANDNETLDIFEFTASQDTELTLIRASAASAYMGTGFVLLVDWNLQHSIDGQSFLQADSTNSSYIVGTPTATPQMVVTGGSWSNGDTITRPYLAQAKLFY